MNYDQEQLQETELQNIEDAFPNNDTQPVSWINVDGLHDVDIIDKISRHLRDEFRIYAGVEVALVVSAALGITCGYFSFYGFLVQKKRNGYIITYPPTKGG